MENSINVSTYFVSGLLVDINDFKSKQFNIAISLDMLNNTFCIYPQEYINKKGFQNISEVDNIQINIESINNKKKNTFEYEIIKDDEICQEYFNNYKYTALSNINTAYAKLDEEYKTKRFSNLEGYSKYIKENKEMLNKANIQKYDIVKEESYDRYICVDQYGNYYIFNSNSIIDYKMILDNYTIDTQEFLLKYNKANDVQKVGYNIQKCIEAINSKDYKYVYNKLDKTFKNNNFNTIDKFEKYIKSNLFESNNITYNDAINQGNVFIYQVTIYDKTQSNNTKNLEIIMQLNKGTDFTMSFNIK